MVSAEEYQKMAEELSHKIHTAKSIEDLNYNRGQLDMLIKIAQIFDREITFKVHVQTPY